MKTLTVGEILVLNNVLSEYPMNLSFGQILHCIDSDSDKITVWEPLGDMQKEELILFIERFAKQIDQEIDLAMR